METDQVEQQNHRCKLCGKSFSSGRSLGGHMRSHVHSSPPITGEKDIKFQKSSRLGYGLRENPKKTFRLSDFIGEDVDESWKHCKECGKAFPSCKALFGHMKCHSERICKRRFGDEEEEEEEEEKSSMESFADDNEPSSKGLILPVHNRKRRSKRASPVIAFTTTGSSSSFHGYEPEQEDVAISLMMLSRAVSEFSDKNSWVLDADEEDEDDSVDEAMNKIPISALLLKKRALFCNNDNSFNGFNVLGSRFQCVTCKKSFQSYHALGGHRANQKRSKGCFAEHRPATTVLKSRVHECVLCGKVFSSGQALGGHKRSHLIPNCGGGNGGDDHRIAAEVQNPSCAATTVGVSEPLDLNFPAPADELSSNLKAWWDGVRRT